MEENKEIISLLIDLNISVRTNNLENTKSLVNQINSLSNSESNLFDYFRINEFFRLNYDNESLRYVIYHLNNYYNMPAFQWAIETEDLASSGTIEAIEDYISNIDLNTIKDYQIPALIRLYTIIQDYDSLTQLKSIINNME